MILSGLLGCLTGLLLAGRFKILMTVPVQVAALIAAAIPVLMGESSLGHQLAVWIVFCLALQACYVTRLALGVSSSQSIQASPRNA